MLAFALSLLSCAAPQPPPDLVVLDATSAILIHDGLITEVRPRNAAGDLREARVIEAARVTAGFVDAHAHPAGLGRLITELDLSDVGTYREVLERIGAATGDGWLVGRGWDQNDWPDAPAGAWPLAADLEAVHPGRPIALRRVDGHALWASPAALAASGVHAATPDPAGGRIIRDAHGAPTGVVIDEAMPLVRVPEPTPEAREAQLRAGLRAIVEAGLTGVHDMGVDDATLAVYERLDAAGELPIRVWCYVVPDSRAAARLLSDGPWGGRHVQVVGIKAFADGALGSRGARLRADYADEPGNRGLELTPTDRLAALATRALAADAQVAVHAIGDAAVSSALDAFEVARAAHPDKRHVPLRVEHAQVVHPDDVPRFAALHVVASFQPTHATSDMPWAAARLGPERAGWAYAWRTLVGAGAQVALGSDFPVEHVEPARGLWAATTRTDPSGAPIGGWTPHERLTEAEAIAGFTSGAAAAVRAERLGQIAPGMRADLTLWRTEPGPGGATRWTATGAVVGGAVVFQAP